MLQLRSVSRAYGTHVILQDASVQLPTTGIVGLVGANGTGKTTLLRLLAGEEQPDRGVIESQGARVGYLRQQDPVTGHDDQTVLAIVMDGLYTAEELAAEITRLSDEISQVDAASAQAQALLERMADAQARHDLVDSGSLEPRVRRILHGLGFSEAEIDAPASNMSGGYRMRLPMVRILAEQPQLLLLDEPTNHLDIDALMWLESFLKDYPGLVVMTSHDRTFLDRCTTHVLAIESGQLWMQPGDYAKYAAHRAMVREHQEKVRANQERERAHMEDFVRRFSAKATKARQASSRKKQIERLEKEMVEVMTIEEHVPHFGIADPPSSPRNMAVIEGLEKSFGDNNLFQGLAWTILRENRIALVGPNGVGKSTLLKMLVGKLQPDAGQVQVGARVQIGYYAQDAVEKLDPDLTVLQLADQMLPRWPERDLRGLLGSLLFSGETVHKQIAVLSGGEKARLVLGLMLAEPHNLLVIDEPTNHLDLESRAALGTALSTFTGTIVAVSHDRHFLNQFANTVVDLHPGKVHMYPGTMDEYEWHRHQHAGAEPAGESAPQPKEANPVKTEKSGGDHWKQRKKLVSEYRRLNGRLEKHAAAMAEIRTQLQDPANASDHKALIALQEELDQIKNVNAETEAAWETVVSQADDMGVDLDG